MVSFAWSSQPDENNVNNALCADYAIYAFNAVYAYNATWVPSPLLFIQN
jgi:hypothetical protein